MKPLILYLLLAFLFLFSIYQFREIKVLKTQTNHLRIEMKQLMLEKATDYYELADAMTNLQRHANKLWFAGKNKNWELANFYAHEIEEAMEEIEKREVMEEDINISKLIPLMGYPAVKKVEESIKQEDIEAFNLEYANLITNCNSCHKAAKYSMIQIKIPDQPVFDNQIYSVEE